MSPTPERARSVHTADGGVVLDVHHGRMFSLNAAGSLIFQLLEQGVSEDRIVEEVARQFSIPSDRAKSDFDDFRKSLEGLALLPYSESSPQR